MHFVRVSNRMQGGLMPLDSVRAAVRREWMNARRLEAEADLYRTLRERYQVVVEEPPAARAAGLNASGVVAMRRLLMLLCDRVRVVRARRAGA